MFIRDSKRFNIYAPATIGGVYYPNFTDPALREELGITEIPDPTPPEEYLTNPDFYFVTEQDEAPYTVWTRKSDEQINQMLVSRYDAALTAHLDSTAQSRRWADRITCAVRAGYPNPWQAEGAAFGQWMDQCNALGYTILAEVQAGTRPLPSLEDFIAEMPPMVWPEGA